MILFDLHNLKSHQIDYVQAFPQADLEDDVYMTIPKRFEVNDGKPKNMYSNSTRTYIAYAKLHSIGLNT